MSLAYFTYNCLVWFPAEPQTFFLKERFRIDVRFHDAQAMQQFDDLKSKVDLARKKPVACRERILVVVVVPFGCNIVVEPLIQSVVPVVKLPSDFFTSRFVSSMAAPIKIADQKSDKENCRNHAHRMSEPPIALTLTPRNS